MLYPFTFKPIFKERIWGGRNLERLYGKPLPKNIAVGESWEICDRSDDNNIVSNGAFAGKTLHWLIQNHRAELLGSAKPTPEGRFPLLIKILDAQEKLSLQVHPPASKCAELGGEPKTEMWFIADATASADLFVGLKRGVTRAEFEQKIKAGAVAECFHHIQVKPGDAIFLPSGRVHAIGAGNIIFEFQQNSDTTYRVFDWNRVDASGKPRELHVEKSLASIDFDDFEPALIKNEKHRAGDLFVRPLVNDPLFKVEECTAELNAEATKDPGEMQIIGLLSGEIEVQHPAENLVLKPGDFCLLPASEKALINCRSNCSFLRVQAA